MNRYTMLLIESLTNMHAGSGDTHYGIVDNLIQRNPVTGFPVIHSTGIKGALNDYFKSIGYYQVKMEKLFGKEGGDSEAFPGRLIFFEANLLTMPLRSNRKVYYNATSPYIMKEYITFLKDFVLYSYNTHLINNWLESFNFNSNTPFYTFDSVPNPEIEDFMCDKKGKNTKAVKDEIEKLTGLELENIAIFNDEYFKKICEHSLPVVARNKIDDEGQSENLFYEEVLPRKTLLYFVLGEENYFLKKDYDDFIAELTAEETIMQIGGNYSVGYGFCKIKELKFS